MESFHSYRLHSIIEDLRRQILRLWSCQSISVHLDPYLNPHDVKALACSPDHRLQQEAWPSVNGRMLRRQLADAMSGFLRTLAEYPPDDVLLITAGPVYPHSPDTCRQELALWRLATHDLPLRCLEDAVDALATIVPRGMRLRTRRLERPWLVYGQTMEAYCGGWKALGSCGLVNPMLLIACGFDPVNAHAIALSFDLDRLVEVQDQWEEICLRRRL